MRENLRPVRAIPPGRIIRRELEARGWTQKDLAAIMDRPEQVISEIINDKKRITADTAHELGQAFGTSSEFWMNLEMNYRLHRADAGEDASAIVRRRQLYEEYPIGELIKRGWIEETNRVKGLVHALCDLLQVPNLEIMPAFALNLRQSAHRDPQTNAQCLWAARVRQLARQQRVGPFVMDRLVQSIPELLMASQYEEAVSQVPQRLLDLGVHFAYVPHLSRTYLDGAAFYLEGHPVLALTMRYGRLDYFWFTLMHELGHIVLGHEGIHLDQLYPGDGHPVGSSAVEAETNAWAATMLLDNSELDAFLRKAGPRFSGPAIKAFAATQSRHRATVLGRLQHDQHVEYSHLRSWLVSVRANLEAWSDVAAPWQRSGR